MGNGENAGRHPRYDIQVGTLHYQADAPPHDKKKKKHYLKKEI